MTPTEKLNIKNLSDVEDIGHAFTAEVNYPGGFVFDAFASHWGPLIESGIGEIFVIRDGTRVVAALGCAFVDDCFSGRKMACENWWFAHKEHRGHGIANQLFDAFEAEAAKRGARKIIMGRLETPQAEKLEALYVRRGYKPLEKTFVKDL